MRFHNQEPSWFSWDIGTMLVVLASDGYAPNQGSARRYVYQVLQVDDEHLRLCAPELGVTSSGGMLGSGTLRRLRINNKADST